MGKLVGNGPRLLANASGEIIRWKRKRRSREENEKMGS
jgi:hypothetical protein